MEKKNRGVIEKKRWIGREKNRGLLNYAFAKSPSIYKF